MCSRLTINVQAWDADGNAETYHISRRARAQCTFLDALDDDSLLPETPADTLQIILHYLNGQGLTLPTTDYPGNLVPFVQVWSLAAQLDLPHLQNHLIDRYQTFYSQACHVRDSHHTHEKKPDSNPDISLVMALEHLEKQCGRGTPAEDFLVVLVARFALDVRKLEDRLYELGIAAHIKNRILVEARNLSADPIKYHIGRFKIDVVEQQFYDPPKVVSPSATDLALVLTMDTRADRDLETQSTLEEFAGRDEEGLWGNESENGISETTGGFLTSESTRAMGPKHHLNRSVVSQTRRQSSSRKHKYSNSIPNSPDLCDNCNVQRDRFGEENKYENRSEPTMNSPLPKCSLHTERSTAQRASPVSKAEVSDRHQQSPRRGYRTSARSNDNHINIEIIIGDKDRGRKRKAGWSLFRCLRW